MYRRFPLLLALLLLAACTTTSSPKGKPQFAPTNLRGATIYVINDVPGIVGPDQVVVADGTAVGPLSRKQYTWFFTRPGVLNLSITDGSPAGRILASEHFAVRAGRSYYIRFRTIGFERKETSVADGFSKEVTTTTKIRGYGYDLVEVPESEGIALVGTHRLVDTYPGMTTVRSSSRSASRSFK